MIFTGIDIVKSTQIKQGKSGDIVIVTTEGNLSLTIFQSDSIRAKALRAGDKVEFLGAVRGREYNGKCYTDLNVSQFRVFTRNAPAPSIDDLPPSQDDLPF